LRDEEERQLDGMLLEDSHRVLKNDGVVVESRLEVRDGGDGRDGGPEEKPLKRGRAKKKLAWVNERRGEEKE